MENKKYIFNYIKVKKLNAPGLTYFETLANEVISKKSAVTIPIYKKTSFVLSSAAAILILITITLNFSKTSKVEDNTFFSMDGLKEDIVYSYIDKNIDDFDAELLTEFISETNLSQTLLLESKKEIDSSPILLDNISSEDILNYFESEEINLTDLEYELFI